MSGLEQTFYIMAIIFMGIGFILLIALVIGVFMIRAKINKIHAQIDAKIDAITMFAERGGELTSFASQQVLKKAKKVLKKKK